MPRGPINIPTIAVSAGEKFAVVVPPGGLSEEEWIATMAGLISSLNRPFSSQKGNVEFIFNLLLLGIPEMKQIMGAWTSLQVVRVTPSKEEFLTWGGVLEGANAQLNDQLPVKSGAVVAEALGVSDRRAVYMALSSLLFCIGKQASESARASVLDNRPDALLRRFGLSEEDQVILPGKTSGPSREVMEQIYNSFANYTEVRATTVMTFLSWRIGRAHLPIHLEIMMNNFNLLRGTGMTHVEAIIKLVQMHPWVLRVPELEPYFHRFTQELQEWENVDAEVRPYHRLLVPQSEYLFLSSEYRPLIAVAGSFIEEVEKTFAGYVYNKLTYQDLIDKIHAYQPGYKPTTQLSKLAELLHVRDEPLPSLPATEKAAASATV